jgi:hypothetical protein
MLLVLMGILAGCSRQNELALSGANGSGDLAPFVFQCATSRGGHAATNALPTIQANWTHQSRQLQDVILVQGDYFTEMQALLKQAYGEPDPKLGSQAVASLGGGQSLTYSPQQSGVVLTLTGSSKQTIVSIMGAQKP